jgi:hypothetical protein
MDGTMFDTERLSLLGWRDAAKKTGIPLTDEMILSFRGRNKKMNEEMFHSWFGEDAPYMEVRKYRDEWILRYLVENEIEYASCYGEIVNTPEGLLETTGVNRTGCMFCMFGIEREREPNRFQRMQRNHPKQYEYCMEKLGLREVLRYCGIPCEYQETLFDCAPDGQEASWLT